MSDTVIINILGWLKWNYRYTQRKACHWISLNLHSNDMSDVVEIESKSCGNPCHRPDLSKDAQQDRSWASTKDVDENRRGFFSLFFFFLEWDWRHRKGIHSSWVACRCSTSCHANSKRRLSISRLKGSHASPPKFNPPLEGLFEIYRGYFFEKKKDYFFIEVRKQQR